MEKNLIVIKPHHFLDYLYDLAIDNRHDEPNPKGNKNGELCRDFMDGKLTRIIFTPLVDDICRPCNQLNKKNKCTQLFDEITTKNYGTNSKNEFNYQLDIKLNNVLPDIFVFNKEQRMIDVLVALQERLTKDIINLYLWKRDNRIENTFLGINKAIRLYENTRK